MFDWEIWRLGLGCMENIGKEMDSWDFLIFRWICEDF